MGSDYLPTTEADLKTFALNFATLIKAAPASYALVAADATVIDTAAKEYASKLDLAVNPPTRTTASIIEKNQAKEALVPILRGYAMQIKSNRAVSEADKANLGLSGADLARRLIPAPLSRPLITIARVDARQHTLRFADLLTPESRAKPAGVEGLQVFCQVADTPPAEPLTSRFQALVTRQPLLMSFIAAEVGKTAYYYARWYTRTGRVGPWSQVASMTVAG